MSHRSYSIQRSTSVHKGIMLPALLGKVFGKLEQLSQIFLRGKPCHIIRILRSRSQRITATHNSVAKPVKPLINEC